MSDSIKWMRLKEWKLIESKAIQPKWKPFICVSGDDRVPCFIHEDLPKMLSREPRILMYDNTLDSEWGNIQLIIDFIRKDERRKIHEEASRGKEVKGSPKKTKVKAKKSGEKEECSKKVKPVGKRKVKAR